MSGLVNGVRSGSGSGLPPPAGGMPPAGLPPFPPPGGPGGPGDSASGEALSFSTDDLTTVASLFTSILDDACQTADKTALSAAIERVKAALTNGDTPTDADMREVMDAMKTSIDDGTISRDDPTTLAELQLLMQQSYLSHQAAVAQATTG